MSDKVLMETFLGFDIYFAKDRERFVADKPALDIHFEDASLWGIKGCIKNTQTKEINKDYIIVDGYFNKGLSKIKLLTVNTPLRKVKYKILDQTENGYDVGKVMDERDPPKYYPLTEHNLKIYDAVKALETEIKGIEGKQKSLVARLSREGLE